MVPFSALDKVSSPRKSPIVAVVGFPIMNFVISSFLTWVVKGENPPENIIVRGSG